MDTNLIHSILHLAGRRGRDATVRHLICVALLTGSAGCAVIVASSQKAQTGGQEGVQQQGDQNMTPERRAAATRAFLGLGALPDKVAAARGEPLFQQNCAFCHGQTAHGATGPSLITSDMVLMDDHGEHLTDIAEFLHVQVEDVANRGSYHVLNILVGNAAKGKVYVEGHCMSCHAAETFAHIASKFRSPEQLQRNWIWPVSKGNMTASVKTSRGAISGTVKQISDFRITLVDSSGETHA